jgi:hypothetical protein
MDRNGMTMIMRELQWWPTGAPEPRKIRVSVGLPEPHPSLGYECTLTIEGFAERLSTAFHNTEGMLALTYALNILPHVIEYRVRAAGGGRVTPPLRVLEDQDVPEDMERELEYLAPGASAPVSIKVAISPPVQNDKTWSCTLTMKGLGDDHVMTVQHVDTLGAILEALYLAPIVLRQLVEPGGRLTCLGSEELGFPVRPGG